MAVLPPAGTDADDAIVSESGKVMFKPWAGPQKQFWDYAGRYALYGGAGFTGKTDLLRWLPWRQVAEENARIKAGEITHSIGWALYLRREMPLLREVLARCQRDFEIACPDLEWKAQTSTYVFPNGYRLTFGHMENENDWRKYQGFQLSMILWDELTTFSQNQFDMLDSWLRQPSGSKLTPVHRAGSNPIGMGRAWVKKFFVDAGKPKKEIVKSIEVDVEDEDGKRHKEKVTRGRIFIPARVSDNKSVDQAAFLASFDGKQKHIVRALRDGDWGNSLGDLIGQCWDEDVHVVKPYAIPSTRNKFRSIHFAYAVSTVAWVAVDYDGSFTVYRDMRVENHTAEMLGDRIRELEEQAGEWFDDADRGSRLRGPLGPKTAWPETGQRGPSAMETLRRAGFLCDHADDNLGAAVDQIRTRLNRRTLAKGVPKNDPGTPGLRYFAGCASLETVPSMPADKADPDLPEPKTEASGYRALCYAAMSRPVIPQRDKPRDSDWDDKPKPKTTRKSRTGVPGMW